DTDSAGHETAARPSERGIKGTPFMTHEHFPEGPAERVALYAAGALPSPECAQLEAHLTAGCADCVAELKQLAPVVAALAAAVPPATPDPRTRAALLQRIVTEARPT